MRISVAADERTGVADAVVAELEPARPRAARARRARRRGARRLGLGQRGGRPRRGRRPRRAGHRLLLDRHRRLDRREQGDRRSARRCAATPRRPAARASGTTRTCWRCRCARPARRCSRRSSTRWFEGAPSGDDGRRGEHPPRGRDRLAGRRCSGRRRSSPARSGRTSSGRAAGSSTPSRRTCPARRASASRLPARAGSSSPRSRPRSTLAPATARPRRFTVTFTFGVRLVAFGELAVTRRPAPAQRPGREVQQAHGGPEGRLRGQRRHEEVQVAAEQLRDVHEALGLALHVRQLELEPAVARGRVHRPHLVGRALRARRGTAGRRGTAAPVTPLGGTAPARRRTEWIGAAPGAAFAAVTSAAR